MISINLNFKKLVIYNYKELEAFIRPIPYKCYGYKIYKQTDRLIKRE